METEFKHSITTTYRVNITVPDITHDYCVMYPSEGRAFDNAVIEAFKGNVGAGANCYAEHEEWADFNTLDEAEAARDLAVDLVVDFTLRAQADLDDRPL